MLVHFPAHEDGEARYTSLYFKLIQEQLRPVFVCFGGFGPAVYFLLRPEACYLGSRCCVVMQEELCL